MRRSLKVVFSLVFALAPAARLAQADVVRQQGEVRYQRLTVINFGDVPVEGTTIRSQVSPFT